jgi:hypothetical protein
VEERVAASLAPPRFELSRPGGGRHTAEAEGFVFGMGCLGLEQARRAAAAAAASADE